MDRLTQQLLRIAAWASQTVNVWLLFGHHDQTVSARCYLNRYRPGWREAYRAINAVFFWQDDHCRASYMRDVEFAEEVLRIFNA
jgi:hypothetical protein